MLEGPGEMQPPHRLYLAHLCEFLLSFRRIYCVVLFLDLLEDALMLTFKQWKSDGKTMDNYPWMKVVITNVPGWPFPREFWCENIEDVTKVIEDYRNLPFTITYPARMGDLA